MVGKKGQYQETVVSLNVIDSFSSAHFPTFPSLFVTVNLKDIYLSQSWRNCERRLFIYYGCSATRLNFLTIMMASEKYF